MNDGLQPDRSVTGTPALEVRTHRRDVERTSAQGAGERSTPFGELEALQVRVQPRTPTRSVTVLVDDGEGWFTLTGRYLDHTQQDGPETAFPAPHARAHRAR